MSLDNLSSALEHAKDQKELSGEVQQQLRAGFSLSMGQVDAVSQDDRSATVWLMDEKKTVPATIAIHPDHTGMFSSIKVGDYVLILHKAGIGGLVTQKIASDRHIRYTAKINEMGKLTHGVNTSTAG